MISLITLSQGYESIKVPKKSLYIIRLNNTKIVVEILHYFQVNAFKDTEDVALSLFFFQFQNEYL